MGTEKLETPLIIENPTDPRENQIKQLRMEKNLAQAVKTFAVLTRRSESGAWEFLAEQGLLAMGATFRTPLVAGAGSDPVGTIKEVKTLP